MTANPQLLYAILAMDSYHRGDAGGITVPLTEIDGTNRLRQNGDNPSGFSAQAYSHGGQIIIAYRGTDDGSAIEDFSHLLDIFNPDGRNRYARATEGIRSS